MVAFSANDPRTATLIDSTTVSGVGYLLTNDSTNNKVDLTEVDLVRNWQPSKFHQQLADVHLVSRLLIRGLESVP